MPNRIACFGGVYNNYLALEAAIEDARTLGVNEMHCLGDLGAFGPYPDRVFPLLDQFNVHCIQGNYDDSIGNQLDDCQCGYTDSRDNHFAQISYDYTLANTSPANRDFLRQLPKQRRVGLGSRQLLLCHGSPRRVNEFLWESTCSDHFLMKLIRSSDCQAVVGTHSGIKWHRHLADGNDFVNVGALGRPENDGRCNVWYTILESNNSDRLRVNFRRVEYDHHRLAREMRQEGLPDEFVETILSGWWTTCLEVLPAKERKRGRY